MINITICKQIYSYHRERIKTIHIDTKVPFNKLIQFLITVSGYKAEDIFSLSLDRDVTQNDSNILLISHDDLNMLGDQSFDQMLRNNIKAQNILSLYCTLSVTEDVLAEFKWPNPQRVLVVKPEQMSSKHLPLFIRDDKDDKIVATVYEQCMAKKYEQILEQHLQILDQRALIAVHKVRKAEIKLQIVDPDQQKTEQSLRMLEQELQIQNQQLQQLEQVEHEKQMILWGMQQTSRGIRILQSLLLREQLTTPEEQNYLLLPPQPSSSGQESLIPPDSTIPPASPLSVSRSLSPTPLNRSTSWLHAAHRINELLMAYNYQYYFDVIACINLNKSRYEDDIKILKTEKIASDKYDDDLEFVENVLFKIADAYPKLRYHWFEYCANDKYWGEQLNYLAMCLTPAGLMFSLPKVKDIRINKLLISGNPCAGVKSENVTVLAFILGRTGELVFDIETLDDEFLNALCTARQSCGESIRVSRISFKGACNVEQLKRLLTFASRIKLFSASRLIDMDIAVYPIANTKFIESAIYHLKVSETRRCEERFVTVYGDIDTTSRVALVNALPKSNKTQWDVKVIVQNRNLSLAASESSSEKVLGHFSQYLVPNKCTRLFIDELPLIQIDVNSGLQSLDEKVTEAQITENTIVSVSLRNPDNSVRSERSPQPTEFINALERMGLRETGTLHLHDITVSEVGFPELMKLMTPRHDLYIDADKVDYFDCHARTNVDHPICDFSSDDISIPSETASEIRRYCYRQPSFVNDYLFYAISHLPEILEKRISIYNREYEVYQNLLALMLRVNVTSLFINARMRPDVLYEFGQALRFNPMMVEIKINGGSISEEIRPILARNKKLADVTATAKALSPQLAAVEKILTEKSPDEIREKHNNILPQIIALMDAYRDCVSGLQSCFTGFAMRFSGFEFLNLMFSVSADGEINYRFSKFLVLHLFQIDNINSHGKSLENILQRCVAMARLRQTLFATAEPSHLVKCLHELITFNKELNEHYHSVFTPLLQKRQPHLSEQMILALRNSRYIKSAIPSSWIIAACELYFIGTPSLHNGNITLALDLAEYILELNPQQGMRMLKFCAVNYTAFFISSGDDNLIRHKEVVQPFYRMQRLMSGKLHDRSSSEDILVVLKMIITLLRCHFLPIVRGEYEGSLSSKGFGTRMEPEVLKNRLDSAQNNPTPLLNIIADILKFNAPSLGSEKPAYFKALEELHKSVQHVQAITQSQGGWVFGYISVSGETNAEYTKESRVQRKTQSNSESISASETHRKSTSEVGAAPQTSKGKQHAEGDAESHQTVAQVPTRHNYVEDKKIYTELSSSGRFGGPTLFSISAVFYSSLLTPQIERARKERCEKQHRSASALTGNASEQHESSSWFGKEQEFEKNFEKAAREFARFSKRRVP